MKIEVDSEKVLRAFRSTGEMRGYANELEREGRPAARAVLHYLADQIEAQFPKPIYSNRDDIFEPRNLDTVLDDHGTYWSYRSSTQDWIPVGGDQADDLEVDVSRFVLVESGPARLVAEAVND